MFTGIIAAIGKVRASEALAAGVRLTIDAGSLDLADVQVGDSIAVNGVCLTAIRLQPHAFVVEVSRHTLDTVQGLALGNAVNLEKALRLADRLGGHLVSGHVDGCGTVTEFAPRGESWHLAIQVPTALARYIATKGSITVNGVSLTVNGVERDQFHVNLIPHTLQATTFAELRQGDRVNLEVDLLARYAERLLARDGEGDQFC